MKTLSAYGINQEGIARSVGLRSTKSVRKHFWKELALGAIEAAAQVSQALYQMAKSGKFPVATIHFLNTRTRWLEVQNGVEKREISRIFWRRAKNRKKNRPPEGDNNPPAAASTADSSNANEGEEQEAGPKTELAAEDLEAPDAQQRPTEITVQAPSAKEPDDTLD